MLRYADMFPSARPSREQEKTWEEQVKEVREAWEQGRQRSAKVHGRAPQTLQHAVNLRVAF